MNKYIKNKTLVRYNPFEDYFYKYRINITKKEIQQLLLFFKNNKNKAKQETTYNQINILNLPLLKNIKNQILLILDKHSLFLDNNWAQLYRKGDKHGIHQHGGSSYSGVLYVSGDGKDGTVFHHPISKIIESSNKKLKTVVMEKFEPGVLILFPSYIPHEVLEQEKDNNRLIISFNTKN